MRQLLMSSVGGYKATMILIMTRPASGSMEKWTQHFTMPISYFHMKEDV